MTFAAITGWGACMPPAMLSNADLGTFLETNDEWIASRTGIRERRISHVSGMELAIVAARRALACADLAPKDVELIIYASCSSDEIVPNSASGVQSALGAQRAASMDLNTACTGFLYGLTTATAMVRTGVVRNAVIIGVELIAPYIDWENRNVAVLFGDGCGAAVVQATDREEGLLGEQLGCLADVRRILRIRGMGAAYANRGVTHGATEIDFDGPEVFKRAVQGMSQASAAVLAKCGYKAEDVDLVVPHQANLRIIEAVARSCGIPMEKVMLTVQRYGNMSAATVPVALAEAVDEGRVKPGSLVLMPAFGAGLAVCSHLVRWGDRVKPLKVSNAALPPCEKTALDIVNAIRVQKLAARESSHPGMSLPVIEGVN